MQKLGRHSTIAQLRIFSVVIQLESPNAYVTYYFRAECLMQRSIAIAEAIKDLRQSEFETSRAIFSIFAARGDSLVKLKLYDRAID